MDFWPHYGPHAFFPWTYQELGRGLSMSSSNPHDADITWTYRQLNNEFLKLHSSPSWTWWYAKHTLQVYDPLLEDHLMQIHTILSSFPLRFIWVYNRNFLITITYFSQARAKGDFLLCQWTIGWPLFFKKPIWLLRLESYSNPFCIFHQTSSKNINLLWNKNVSHSGASANTTLVLEFQFFSWW